ncbi:HAD family hydrolase [Reyranella sp.]|uniref:HAD family hydrolase n=1 Tax=Reyranella sp. TaxID=1929291 RepID=UPI003D0E79C4
MSSSPVLVLDIDGVIVHSAPDWPAKLQATFGLAAEELLGFFQSPIFAQVLQGRLDVHVALHEWLEPRDLADRVHEFVSLWLENDSIVDREVLAMADAWRGRTGGRVFAASNQEHHRVAFLRDHLGLGAHFDEIVYSAALGVCKPDRVFFTNAQARMAVTAARAILFVDDRPANVDAARMCGWRAALYRGRESLARVLAHVE